MNATYMGHLSEDDPLYSYLEHDIQHHDDADDSSTYRVFKLNGTNDVYMYEDRTTGRKLIGKFFLTSAKSDAERADSHLTREFDNLSMMRDSGLTGSPHKVVEPLGRSYELNALLVTECFEGQLLSEVILEAIRSGDHHELYAKLTALAYFLATFHNRTAIPVAVDFHQDCAYMDTLIERLRLIDAVDADEIEELQRLRD